MDAAKKAVRVKKKQLEKLAFFLGFFSAKKQICIFFSFKKEESKFVREKKTNRNISYVHV